MPVYVYSCPNCGAEFEKLSPMPGTDMVRCVCGHEAKRIPAPMSFSFGWRLTDGSHVPINPYTGPKEDKFERDV